MFAPILLVNLVHFGKILHIINEDIDLDGIFKTCSGFFEHGGEVFDALMLLDPTCQKKQKKM